MLLEMCEDVLSASINVTQTIDLDAPGLMTGVVVQETVPSQQDKLVGAGQVLDRCKGRCKVCVRYVWDRCRCRCGIGAG